MHPNVVIAPHQRLHIGIDEEKMASLFHSIAERAASLAKDSVKQGGRTGRFRDDGSIASREGEAPHTETGELMRSIGVRRNGNEITLFAKADHAAVHEFGKRPFLKPALERAIMEHSHRFGEIIKAEAR